MRDYHKSDNEKPLHFELPGYSNGLFITAPPNFSLSFIKKSSFLCSVDLQMACHNLLVLDHNPVLFLNKSASVGQITGSFISKVDTFLASREIKIKTTTVIGLGNI